KDQKQRGSAVVYDDCGAAENRFEQLADMDVALAPGTGLQTVFQVAVAVEDLKWRERRAAQVGMKHDAGGVDDMPVGRLRPSGKGVFHGSLDWVRQDFAGLDGRSRGLDSATCF